MGPSLEGTLLEAAALSKAGNDSAAIELYQSVVKNDSEHATAWYCLGVLYARAGEMKESIEAFERSDNIFPDHPPTLANLAYLLVDQSQKSASEYAISAKVQISDDEQLDSIAEYSESVGDKDRVFVESRQIEEASSQSVSSSILEENIDIFAEARSLTSAGKHSRAVSIWKGLLEDSPNSPEVWRGLGEALRSAGYDDRANQCLKRAEAIESTPQSEATETELDNDDATEALILAAEQSKSIVHEESERGDIDESVGWYNMGINLLGEGKNDEAISSFEKAIGGCPSSEIELKVKAQNGRGNALYNSGRFPESIVAYHTAIEMDPNSVSGRSLFNMGSSYAAVEMFDDAIKCFTQALDRGLGKEDSELCEKQISRCRLLSREQSKRQSRSSP
jgi:tetratricopeptide (TPR) repeat protein